MNVLGLFDGISCGQLALERAGIQYDSYFASEIDKYAIAVTQYRFPNTIQIGDVQDVKACNLPQIDLLIGGSPCQGFSVAGKRLAFDDPRSKLFFEYVRLLKECNPKYFLLENVRMKKEYLDIITEYMGVKPIKINSALVSAQNRVRYYWTNIPNITQPEDKGILLKDILECDCVDRDKSYCIDASYWKGTSHHLYTTKHCRQAVFHKPHRIGIIGNGGQGERIYSINGKSVSISANGGGRGAKTGLYHIPHGFKKEKVQDVEKCPSLRAQSPGNNHLIVASRGRYNEDGTTTQHIEPRTDNKSNTLTTVQKDNLLSDGYALRKLTPIECERLQTLPDNYTFVPWQQRMMSNTQRYKMIGNAWTVDVIAHIFRGLLNENL